MAEIVACTIYAGQPLSTEERRARLEAARQVLERAGDDLGLGLYWWGVSSQEWAALHMQETIAACERALHHFRRAGARARSQDVAWWIQAGYALGETPARIALERIEDLEQTAADSVLARAASAASRSRLLAMVGEIDEARQLQREAHETVRAAGMSVSAALQWSYASFIESRAGNPDGQEQALRASLAELGPLEQRTFASTIAFELAECVYRRGRFEEVRELCAVGSEWSQDDDIVNFMYADALEGCLLAQEGRFAAGIPLVMRALERVDTTDFYLGRFVVMRLLAEVLQLDGRTDEAAASARQALDCAEAKGDVTGAARTRERFDELGIEVAGA
jgi:tetratricopeptide (TPR) repeat protein